MNLHLISFASSEEKYFSTMKRFHRESVCMGVFKTINLFSGNNCFEYCEELLEHKKFMESTRAYGFWMWKFFLISELMKSIPEDDVICYADLGCTFNLGGKERMCEYYSLVMENGSLCFDISHLERDFTKLDTYLRIFPNNEKYLHTGQRCSTTYFLKNNKENKSMIDESKLISVENNYHYIDDTKSTINYKNFSGDHRYDQSIFSLLSKKYDFHCIPDETYWHPNWTINGKKYPIWATRIR